MYMVSYAGCTKNSKSPGVVRGGVSQKQLHWVMCSIDAVKTHALAMLRYLHVYLFYACPQKMTGTLRGLKAPFILQGT